MEARRELGKLALDPAYVLQAQDGAPANDMAIGFDRPPIAGGDRGGEALPARAFTALRRP